MSCTIPMAITSGAEARGSYSFEYPPFRPASVIPAKARIQLQIPVNVGPALPDSGFRRNDVERDRNDVEKSRNDVGEEPE